MARSSDDSTPHDDLDTLSDDSEGTGDQHDDPDGDDLEPIILGPSETFTLLVTRPRIFEDKTFAKRLELGRQAEREEAKRDRARAAADQSEHSEWAEQSWPDDQGAKEAPPERAAPGRAERMAACRAAMRAAPVEPDAAPSKRRPCILGLEQERDLWWYFGFGLATTSPRSQSLSDAGIVGNGSNVRSYEAPDPDVMVRAGHVSSSLHRLDGDHYETLAALYGDIGMMATNGGLNPERAWRAVAPLTQAAQDSARAWAERESRKGRQPIARRAESRVAYEADRRRHVPRAEVWESETGPLVVHWLARVWAGRDVSPADREAMLLIESQARARIEAARHAFAAVHKPRVEGVWATQRRRD